MFCFVAAENEKICIECENKQWCFTLDQKYEFGKSFYSYLEEMEPLEIQVQLYESNLITEFHLGTTTNIKISETVTQNPKFKAGDIVIFNSDGWYIYFLAEDADYVSGLKVGEFENSFIADFKSFLEDKSKVVTNSLTFTFLIKQSESPQLGPKIIITTIIWLLLLLPLLLLVYFIFK